MIGAKKIDHTPMAASSSPRQGSRLISRVLPVAIKFWLQTQLDKVGDLVFEVQATDRQILSGYIPGIALSAQQAVYQGVLITDVEMQASDIEINIGQVLRGKPLRLKQAFPIEGQVVFDIDALASSSTESILAEGLLDIWQTLLTREDVIAEIATHYGPHIAALHDPQLSQHQSRLETLDTELVLHLISDGQINISLRGALEIDHGHILRLAAAQWRLSTGAYVYSDALSGFCWNLGEQTHLQSLKIQNEHLTCQCRIMVQP